MPELSEAERLAAMTLEQRADWIADAIVGRRPYANQVGAPLKRDALWRDIRSRALHALSAPPPPAHLQTLWSCGHRHANRGEAILCGKVSDNLKAAVADVLGAPVG